MLPKSGTHRPSLKLLRLVFTPAFPVRAYFMAQPSDPVLPHDGCHAALLARSSHQQPHPIHSPT